MAAIARTPVAFKAPAAAAKAANASAKASLSVAAPFAGVRAPMMAARKTVAARGNLVVRAVDLPPMEEQQFDDPFENRFPNEDFINRTIAEFPDAQIANAEQAMALFDRDGYVWLDVRPELQWESVGHVLHRPPRHSSFNVPAQVQKKRFEDGEMIVDTTDVDMGEWVKGVQAVIPDTNTKIIVGCKDGKTKAIDCLMALDDAGYGNIVGMKGGFRSWYMTWDNKLVRRVFGEYAENWSASDNLASGTSAGIHASGAGFENQDASSGDFWGAF